MIRACFSSKHRMMQQPCAFVRDSKHNPVNTFELLSQSETKLFVIINDRNKVFSHILAENINKN